MHQVPGTVQQRRKRLVLLNCMSNYALAAPLALFAAHGEEQYSCPNCKSSMVIALDSTPVPSEEKDNSKEDDDDGVTPVQSTTGSVNERNFLRNIRKFSTPRKESSTEIGRLTGHYDDKLFCSHFNDDFYVFSEVITAKAKDKHVEYDRSSKQGKSIYDFVFYIHYFTLIVLTLASVVVIHRTYVSS